MRAKLVGNLLRRAGKFQFAHQQRIAIDGPPRIRLVLDPGGQVGRLDQKVGRFGYFEGQVVRQVDGFDFLKRLLNFSWLDLIREGDGGTITVTIIVPDNFIAFKPRKSATQVVQYQLNRLFTWPFDVAAVQPPRRANPRFCEAFLHGFAPLNLGASPQAWPEPLDSKP